jgi:hypothetical protein
MLKREFDKIVPEARGKTCECKKPAEIYMRGYAEDNHDLLLCQFCALQLVRKIMEDLCDLAGDRHG